MSTSIAVDSPRFRLSKRCPRGRAIGSHGRDTGDSVDEEHKARRSALLCTAGWTAGQNFGCKFSPEDIAIQ
jgi:hypothetical protein